MTRLTYVGGFAFITAFLLTVAASIGKLQREFRSDGGGEFADQAKRSVEETGKWVAVVDI